MSCLFIKRLLQSLDFCGDCFLKVSLDRLHYGFFFFSNSTSEQNQERKRIFISNSESNSYPLVVSEKLFGILLFDHLFTPPLC